MKSRSQLFASLSVAFAGLIIEHFDVMLVNLFATSMTAHFFQPSSPSHLVVIGFLGYGISFVFRPLGAAFFGMMGDRIGRRQSMLVSLAVMSVATLLLGLIPSYAQIGMYSTLLFVICRIAQGMSVGGEYGAAMTYAFEATQDRKTFSGSLMVSATHLGGLIATLLASRFTHGFQTAFIIAGIAGAVSLAFRSFMVETLPEKEKVSSFKEIFKTVIKDKTAFRKVFFIGASLVFIFYSSLIYLNEVIFQEGLATREEIFVSNAFLLVLWMILPAILGFAVDHYKMNYKKVMSYGCMGIVFLAFPVLRYTAESLTFFHIFLAQLLISGIHAVFCFGTPRFISEQFETGVRNTGVSFGYSLGASFTAAATPLVCHGLVQGTQNISVIAIPMAVLACFAALQLKAPELKKSEVAYGR